MKIPKSFTQPHQPGNAAACATLKRDASRVMRRLACDLGLRQRDFTVRERRRRRDATDLYALHYLLWADRNGRRVHKD
ncbi:conserved hypothetical protein [Cupriavidus necator]|uniref:Uncharacterized protein n=1 Tax=Cupriavidus necator TaxID=106590 RepID=A0A1K0JQ87_CUPNE|nr:conserved hypothetical protein [Cupriavidus necator]